jgi:hypothetical protein
MRGYAGFTRIKTMKPSTALKKARTHSKKIEELLEPINIKLQEILGDEGAHIVDQAGDGFCVCYGDATNAALLFLDIDKALMMGKVELLETLDNASI